MNPIWVALATASPAGVVRRACAACAAGGEPCPACAGEEDERGAVRPKLRVGPPDDRFEREADRVADQVMRTPLPGPGTIAGGAERGVQRAPAAVEEPAVEEEVDEEQASLQRAPTGDVVEEEDDEGAVRGTLRRKGSGDGGFAVPSAEQAYIGGLPSRGEHLPRSVRAEMEPRFGHGFDGVRVHTDAAAQRSAGALGARAYTVGSDVVFGAGEYAPHSSAGMRLLAHELTHVVQQGGGSPLPPSAAPAGPSPSAVTAREAGGPARTVRRQERELEVGGAYEIRTPQGGNLMLRVQPTPARTLEGEQCGGASECPNTVGNVKSGTPAVIKEKRLYGWYAVETETVGSGTRVGFVHIDYLKPRSTPQSDVPEAAYDEEGQQCLSVDTCEAPPEAEDVLVPEEAEDADVFGLGDEALEAEEEGTREEVFGIIQTDDGANLWPEMGRSVPHLGTLPLNTLVFVERRIGSWASVYVEKHQEGKSLPVGSGTHGFIDAARVNTDMPDPGSRLHRITTDGQGALALAVELYPNYTPDCAVGGHACRDHRYIVNVLAAVNAAKGRNYIYKENPDDGWDKAKVKKGTQDARGNWSGGQIWVPGMELIKALEGQVDSGSISLEALTTLKDIVIGIAAFVVGLLHGAVMSIVDIFVGIWDLIVLAKDIIVKLFKGTLVSDAKGLWDDISQISAQDILDMVGEKWNGGSTWEKWNFRGYVIGYAIVEILLLVFSGGIVTAVKWAGKAGKFGKFAKYLAELPRVKKFIEAGKALKGKGIDKIRATMQAAQAISEAHGWAAKALRLPLGILRRLSEADVGKLKRLPQWARERFARMTDSVKLRLLGCSSPCKVDPDKIVEAMKLATKGGTKLADPSDVLRVLKTVDPDFKTAKISTKLRKKGSAVWKLIDEAKLTDVDLHHLAQFVTAGDKANPAQAYRTFVRYLTNVVPAKVGPDIEELNRIAAAIVKSEVRRGSALKGAMFEQWIAIHVPELAGKSFGRITFDLKSLIKKTFPPYRRHVDKWIPDVGEIWDMKHQMSKVPTGQADDYAALVGKVAPDGKTVKSVNYLFPTKEVAELNRHLMSRYQFAVYYIDEATNALVKLK